MDISLIFPHQLFPDHPALSKARPVYLLEDALFFGPDPHWSLNFHAKKLMLHRASMRAYRDALTGEGYQVHYVECIAGKATDAVLAELLTTDIDTLHLCDPVDHILSRRLRRITEKYHADLVIYPSPNFLSPRDWLDETLGNRKKPFMATFYKAQRQRLGLLMEPDGTPTGGKWSFDEENRKKLPKGHIVPPISTIRENAHTAEAKCYVGEHFPDSLGQCEGFAYPVDRKEALDWLEKFLAERFYLFGDYEDAIHTHHRTLYHSVLTPMLNIGLLSPHEIIDRAMAYAKEHRVPLNTVEGFVRQIIGWREFMRAMYELHGVAERNSNFWGFTREMPAALYDGTTGIDPIDETIRRVLEDGYCHHIERLMILGNFMLLCRIHPDAVYRWFMELFVDAYDWVMVPNVYGMSQFADGGIFTTKPYLSGSNYIRKMSDYKKGPWCEAWDGLFWSFVADHHEVFLKNHRMSQMGHLYNRMTNEKRQIHRENADNFIATLFA